MTGPPDLGGATGDHHSVSPSCLAQMAQKTAWCHFFISGPRVLTARGTRPSADSAGSLPGQLICLLEGSIALSFPKNSRLALKDENQRAGPRSEGSAPQKSISFPEGKPWPLVSGAEGSPAAPVGFTSRGLVQAPSGEWPHHPHPCSHLEYCCRCGDPTNVALLCHTWAPLLLSTLHTHFVPQNTHHQMAGPGVSALAFLLRGQAGEGEKSALRGFADSAGKSAAPQEE